MTKCGIYLITHNTSGKIYIGQSANIQRRWWTHGAGDQETCPKLHRAIQKHGKEAFTLTVLEECPQGQLTEREQFYLDQMQPFGDRGYNLATRATPGTSNKGKPKTGQTAAGEGNCHNKRVDQYDHSGHYVTTYYSITEAARAVGIQYMGIINCIKGRARTAGGYFWVLEADQPSIRPAKTRCGMVHSEETKKKISKANAGNRGLAGASNPSHKTVHLHDTYTEKTLVFDTVRLAALHLGMHQTTVTRAYKSQRLLLGRYRIVLIE